MIDFATSDEEKVTLVYKLDEICELLRSLHPSIVKELSEFILKHIVKELSDSDHCGCLHFTGFEIDQVCSWKMWCRVYKGNADTSVAIRQLLQYKGQLDSLKGEALNKAGDALNKAVRGTAQEAISVVFYADDKNSKQPPSASASTDLNRWIEGFGNTNFQGPSQEKKSFLNEVVDSAPSHRGILRLSRMKLRVEHTRAPIIFMTHSVPKEIVATDMNPLGMVVELRQHFQRINLEA